MDDLKMANSHCELDFTYNLGKEYRFKLKLIGDKMRMDVDRQGRTEESERIKVV